MIGAVLSAVAFSVAVFFLLGDHDQAAVLRELPKLTYQFLLVVLLGAFLKFVLDRRAALLAARDAMEQYRGDLLRRTVGVADAVRRVPMLIAARRDYTEYDTQMCGVIGAYLELWALAAELEHQRDAAFEGWDLIIKWLRTMQRYLESLIAEFRALPDQDIPGLELKADDGRARQPEVWRRLQELPVLGDMLRTDEAGPGSSSTYYRDYLKPDQDVLNLMRSELVQGRSRPAARLAKLLAAE